MGDFKKLKVWQEAKNLAVEIYKISNKGEFKQDFGLKDQIRRSAVSIASNIAEGEESQTPKQGIRYFYIAKASTAETITQTIIAYEVGYIDEIKHEKIVDKGRKISSMLHKLIEVRSKW